jgi:hypothetical protein
VNVGVSVRARRHPDPLSLSGPSLGIGLTIINLKAQLQLHYLRRFQCRFVLGDKGQETLSLSRKSHIDHGHEKRPRKRTVQTRGVIELLCSFGLGLQSLVFGLCRQRRLECCISLAQSSVARIVEGKDRTEVMSLRYNYFRLPAFRSRLHRAFGVAFSMSYSMRQWHLSERESVMYLDSCQCRISCYKQIVGR